MGRLQETLTTQQTHKQMQHNKTINTTQQYNIKTIQHYTHTNTHTKRERDRDREREREMKASTEHNINRKLGVTSVMK